MDGLGDLMIYAKSKEIYLRETLGIENIPSKATFGRILSMIDGKRIEEAILEILRQHFGTDGEVIAIDGKAVRSSSKDVIPIEHCNFKRSFDKQRCHACARGYS